MNLDGSMIGNPGRSALRSPFSIGIVVLSVVVATANAKAADIALYRDIPSDDFMQTWLLCGPFPLKAAEEKDNQETHLQGFEIDFLQSHGGETGLAAKAGQIEKFEGGSNRWILHSSDEKQIDLDDVLTEEPSVAAYAFCEIESPRTQACVLALGTNDGVRVWLNGERIWDVTKGRPLQADTDLLPVVLQKGKNTLLLKVEERGGAWGFACRLLSFSSDEFAMDRLGLFQIVNRDDGTVVCKLENEKMFSEIVDDFHFKVTAVGVPNETVWEVDRFEGEEIAIGIDPKFYGEYILNADFTFAGGEARQFSIPFNAGKREDYTLFDNGSTDYAIVVGKEASESERWAAHELRHWLQTVSGADFPILNDASQSPGPKISIGLNPYTEKLLASNLMPFVDNDESFYYKNIGPSIVILGGRQRGTMYGVMTFLEREMGCRWYTPRVTVAPNKENYRFHYLMHTESPGIRVRNVFFHEAFDPTWAARNKSNGLLTFGGVREQIGGIESYWAVHTFNHFMPPSEFFEEHPEYYSLIDGKRVGEHAQLCLTNPDVKRIVKERALAYIREHPEHRIYSVSQNDGYGPCQCEKCQALVKREGSESGPILELVNEIAEEAEKEFPDKYIGTLAYVYSRKPPKTLRPRQNVVIRLCSFECCRGHDFYSCPLNKSFIHDIETWSAIAPHLYIWDYVVEFSHYLMPFPNFNVFQRNIQCFRENNAIGVMPQGSYQSRGGEFAELRMYLLSKLLWNPDCDVETVIDDFMYGYYGRSGQYIRAYFDFLQGQVTPELHVHHFHPEAPIFTDAFIRHSEALFDRAESVADNEEIRQRVEMARIPILYIKCVLKPFEAKRDGTYARFCTIVEREGITHYAESGAKSRKAFRERVEAAE